MKDFQNVDEILDFAIAGEQEAHDFYIDLASKMEQKAMKDVFIGFAKEEMGHRKKLEMAKEGKLEMKSGVKVDDLKISEYVVDVEPKGDMDYQDALVLAMKKEKAAFRLYMDLSQIALDKVVSDLFLAMAQEEAKHKLRFELEYDEHVLEWN